MASSLQTKKVHAFNAHDYPRVMEFPYWFLLKDIKGQSFLGKVFFTNETCDSSKRIFNHKSHVWATDNLNTKGIKTSL